MALLCFKHQASRCTGSQQNRLKRSPQMVHVTAYHKVSEHTHTHTHTPGPHDLGHLGSRSLGIRHIRAPTMDTSNSNQKAARALADTVFAGCKHGACLCWQARCWHISPPRQPSTHASVHHTLVWCAGMGWHQLGWHDARQPTKRRALRIALSGAGRGNGPPERRGRLSGRDVPWKKTCSPSRTTPFAS
jgi:hypothetical protein